MPPDTLARTGQGHAPRRDDHRAMVPLKTFVNPQLYFEGWPQGNGGTASGLRYADAEPRYLKFGQGRWLRDILLV